MNLLSINRIITIMDAEVKTISYTRYDIIVGPCDTLLFWYDSLLLWMFCYSTNMIWLSSIIWHHHIISFLIWSLSHIMDILLYLVRNINLHMISHSIILLITWSSTFIIILILYLTNKEIISFAYDIYQKLHTLIWYIPHIISMLFTWALNAILALAYDKFSLSFLYGAPHMICSSYNIPHHKLLIPSLKYVSYVTSLTYHLFLVWSLSYICSSYENY